VEEVAALDEDDDDDAADLSIAPPSTDDVMAEQATEIFTLKSQLLAQTRRNFQLSKQLKEFQDSRDDVVDLTGAVTPAVESVAKKRSALALVAEERDLNGVQLKKVKVEKVAIASDLEDARDLNDGRRTTR